VIGAYFETRPAQFRNIYPVTFICMHGSPLSRHDNRALWKTCDYREFGIIGEPCFDVDYALFFKNVRKIYVFLMSHIHRQSLCDLA
jgi:hypothetical protein